MGPEDIRRVSVILRVRYGLVEKSGRVVVVTAGTN